MGDNLGFAAMQLKLAKADLEAGKTFIGDRHWLAGMIDEAATAVDSALNAVDRSISRDRGEAG